MYMFSNDGEKQDDFLELLRHQGALSPGLIKSHKIGINLYLLIKLAHKISNMHSAHTLSNINTHTIQHTNTVLIG